MSHLRKVEAWLTEHIEALPAVKKLVSSVDNQRAAGDPPYPRLMFRLLPNQRVSRTLCGQVESIRANYEVVVIGKNTGFEALASVEDALHGLLDSAVVKATASCPAFDSTLQQEIRRENPDKVDMKATLYEVGGVFQFFVTP